MKKLLLLSLLSVLLLGSSFIALAQTTEPTVICPVEPCNNTPVILPTVPTTTVNPNPPTVSITTTASDILLCHRNAVAAREANTLSAFTAYQTAMQTALTTRASALDTAWANSDAEARKKAVTEAWNAYKKTSQANNKIFTTAKNTGWKTYNTAIVACKQKAKNAKLSPLVLPRETASNDFKTL